MTTLGGEQHGDRHVLVIAGGDIPSRDALDAAWPGWSDGAGAVIAADAGLAGARSLGLEPTLLVGDLDSIDPSLLSEVEAMRVPIRRSPAAKDESDAELALLEALRTGATRVTILGAFGGSRIDHELANIWLLAHPAAAGVQVVLLDERTRVSLLVAPGADGAPVTRPLPGVTGAAVSLLPFGGDAIGITTHGLRYVLRDEPLLAGPARGLSNVRDAADAAVTLRAGRLLVLEAAS